MVGVVFDVLDVIACASEVTTVINGDDVVSFPVHDEDGNIEILDYLFGPVFIRCNEPWNSKTPEHSLHGGECRS